MTTKPKFGFGHDKCVTCKKVATKQKAPLTYAFGDVVLLEGKEGVVTDITITSDGVEYAVDGSAWFQYDDLEFVKRATKKTITASRKLLEEELEGEEL